MSRTAEADAREPSEFAPSPTPRRRGRAKRWVITVLVLLGLVVVLAGLKFAQIKTMIDAGKAMVPPPESVTSAKVEKVEWQPVHPAVATLVAFRGVTLSAEVTGTVREIGFQDGATVKKGAVLVRFDTSSEEAQLASAQAEAALTKQSLERAHHLFKAQVSAQSEVDTAQAKDAEARAAVANLQAIIAKKIIRAPFDGRVGIRSVELGQVVSPGAPIVSLHTVTPIYAEFQLPQQALSSVKLDQKVKLTVDVFPGASWEGAVTTINPEIDPGTRNVRIRATVPNADGRLTPGMFANVDVLADQTQQVLVVPATAVVYAPYGDSVYVIEKAKEGGEKAGLVAHQRFVRLGDRRGDYVAVTSGLNGEETVVSNGAFKLRNGQSVAVNNTIAPDPSMTPNPVDQ